MGSPIIFFNCNFSSLQAMVKKWLYVAGDFLCYSFVVGIFLSRSAVEIGLYGILLVVFLLFCVDAKQCARALKHAYNDYLWQLSLVLMGWFFIAFLIRKVDARPEYYFKHLLYLYSGFLLPLLGIGTFLLISNKTFLFFKRLIAIGAITMLVNALLGLINFYTGPNAFTEFLGLGYHKQRLISYHFYIVTASLLGQLYFILFYFTLHQTKHYKHIKRWQQKVLLVLYIISLIIFPFTMVLTWAKFLIFFFCLLLAPANILLIFILFPRLTAHKWRTFWLLLIGIIIVGIITTQTVLNTKNRFSTLYHKVQRAWHNDDILALGTSVYERFIYIKNGARIFKRHPLSGVGPFAFIDYMADNYIGERKSLRRQTYRYTSSHPHNDFIGLTGQVGLVGFILYYALICSLARRYYGYYKNSTHAKSSRLYALGLMFGLFFFVANGVTDSNLQHAHMLMLSFYVIASLLLKKEIKSTNNHLNTLDS